MASAGYPVYAAARGERRAGLKQGALRSLNEMLESIPTLFGRLIKISSTLDLRMQQYQSDDLGVYCAAEDINDVMGQVHQDLLVDWLNRPMGIRVSDMAAYFRREGPFGIRKLRALRDGRGFNQLLPLNIMEIQRRHFHLDMKVLVALVAARLDA
jgi:hypothetical protein